MLFALFFNTAIGTVMASPSGLFTGFTERRTPMSAEWCSSAETETVAVDSGKKGSYLLTGHKEPPR